MKHTQGPWTTAGIAGRDYRVLRENGQNIALVERDSWATQSEQLANARLIAAAPSMLDVLVVIKQWAESRDGTQEADETALREIAEAAHNAISLATGDNTMKQQPATPLPWNELCEDGRFGDGHIVTHADIQRVMQEEIDNLRASFKKELGNAAAALAVIANHAKHPGCADQNNLSSIRGFALEAFRNAKSILRELGEL